MENIVERSFTIVDPQNMKTMAFLVNGSDVDGEKFNTLQKLDCAIKEEDGRVKKTFFINEPIGDSDKDVLLLTMNQERALLNSAVLQNDKLFISKEPTPLDYKMLYNDAAMEYKDIKYTPNFKRPISIVDPEIGDEVRPVLYYDAEDNAVKGKIKLLPNKAYIALEVRDTDIQ